VAGAVPAHNTVAATPRPGLPGQTSNSPWGNRLISVASMAAIPALDALPVQVSLQEAAA